MIVTLMVLLLVSALMVGFTTAIIADQRASGLDRDQTQAYAAAHAGLEQLTADLSGLFATDFSPTAEQISNVTATPPDLPHFTFVEPRQRIRIPDQLQS
jgi:Tfp pilus assembly protein PilX